MNPITYLWKMPSAKARFQKGGITDPEEHYIKTFTKPASEFWTWGYVFSLVVIFFVGIANLFLAIIKEVHLQVYYLIIFGILSAIINHLLLFRHDKYLRYFKEFDKMEKAERTKWAWISFMVVLGIMLFTFGSYIILTYRLHH